MQTKNAKYYLASQLLTGQISTGWGQIILLMRLNYSARFGSFKRLQNATKQRPHKPMYSIARTTVLGIRLEFCLVYSQ